MNPPPRRTLRRALAPGAMFLLLALLLTTGAGQAAARPDAATDQDAPPGADPAASTIEPQISIIDDSEDEAEHVSRAAGLRLARLALLYLRQLGDPGPADYRLVAMVMDEAGKLAPTNAEIVRRAVEAWHAAGDEDGVLRATERLVLLDPDDTVSQLRLIAANIRKRHQDADSRLAVYDRLLGAAGARLDPSIRSRLALDDAMLSRELGDDERFLRRLTQAVQLDSTNKEAASMAATYYLARMRDPLGRVEILTNLILADPHDPTAHNALKQEFMSHGAYWGAMRFSRRVRDLHTIYEIQQSREHKAEESVIRWGLEGPRGLLNHMQQEENATRHQIDRLRRAYIEAEMDPDEIPPYTPDPILERIRLIASLSISAGEDASRAMPHVLKGAEESIRQYIEYSREKPEFLEQAVRMTRRIQSELLWLLLWSGADTQRAMAIFEDIRAHIPEVEQQLYDAFFKIEAEQVEAAGAILRSIADAEPRAYIGLGLIAEIRGDQAEAVRQYAHIALNHDGAPPHPEIPYGLWTRTRIQFLIGEPLRTPETAAKLNEYAAGLPRAIEAITTAPRNFMYLSVEQVNPIAPPLDPMELRVRLRNLANIPLPLGPRSTLNTSLLLIPRVLVEGRQLTDQIKPEVASINRRMRLRPGETLETIVWAGQGETGAIVDQIVAHSSSVRWRAMQNFRVDQETGLYKTGVLAVSAETDRQTRSRLHHASDRPDVIIETIEVAQGRILLETIMRARHVLFNAERLARADENVGEMRAAVAEALAERFRTMSPEERVFALLTLPAAWIFEECREIDEAALHDDNRHVRTAYLLSRLASRDDEVFALIDARDDEFLHEFSRLIRRRLGAGDRPVSPQLAPDAEFEEMLEPAHHP